MRTGNDLASTSHVRCPTRMQAQDCTLHLFEYQLLPCFESADLFVIVSALTTQKVALVRDCSCMAQKLAGADPENKRHCIKILSHFEFRDHVFMVFEPMAMNLREVLKKVRRFELRFVSWVAAL